MVFDSVRNFLFYLNDDDRGEYEVPYKAGYAIGYAVYLVIRPQGRWRP